MEAVVSYEKVPVYLCNPDTLEIVHRCSSFSSAALLCNVSRQAVHDALKRGTLMHGFRVVLQSKYPQEK